MNAPGADMQKHLHTLFSDSIKSIDPCWKPCDWSRVSCLELRDGTRLFLKGTPRSRNEVLVMQRFHGVCSTCMVLSKFRLQALFNERTGTPFNLLEYPTDGVLLISDTTQEGICLYFVQAGAPALQGKATPMGALSWDDLPARADARNV